MDCIPVGCTFFPIAEKSSRSVTPSGLSKKSKVVKPNAPRVSREGIWGAIEPLWNRVVNTALNHLPRSFVEKKVAGYMDYLIDEMAHSNGSEGVKKLDQVIADIDTLVSGLNCMDVFRKQIRSKVHTLNPHQFATCLEKLDSCIGRHPGNEYIKMMKSYFALCKEGDNRVRKFFDKFFEINKAPKVDEFTRPIRLLNIPANSFGFPEEFASVKSLARDIAKKMNDAELGFLQELNVCAYEGQHKQWAEICSRAAEEERIHRENEIKIKASLGKTEKIALAKRIENPVQGFILQVDNFLKHTRDSKYAGDERGISNLCSLAMGLAKQINSLEPSNKEIVRNAIESILGEKAQLKTILKSAKCFYIGTQFIDMKAKISKGIEDFCESQLRCHNRRFNSNPKNIADPVEPIELLDMMFDAAFK